MAVPTTEQERRDWIDAFARDVMVRVTATNVNATDLSTVYNRIYRHAEKAWEAKEAYAKLQAH